MKKYQHLDFRSRDRIEALWRAGHTKKEISEILGVHKSTISRELNKHEQLDGNYQSSNAEHKARIKRGNSKYQGMKIERNQDLKKFIIQELMRKRSPDEIAGRMEREKINLRVNKDAIYKWLYSSFGERYCKYLCTKRKKKKFQKKTIRREMIPNRIGLEWRPEEGRHAEGDTFVSPRKSGSLAAVAIVGLKEEKYLSARKIPNMKTESLKQAVWNIQTEIIFDTLTLDNGIENREHEQFRTDTYFCDAHAPWQKPFIESSIGLIRRWEIPKGTDLNNVSEERLEKCIEFLNNKYRKSLGYRSAREVAEENGILKNINNRVALHPRI